MDDVVRGVVLHADRVFRQLQPEQQVEAAEALRARIDERLQKSEARRRFEALGCDGKVRHPDEATADGVRGNHRDGHRMYAYECGQCGSWHLAHRRHP